MNAESKDRQIFRVGLVQVRSGREVHDNLAAAGQLIRLAVQQGAKLVITPEMTNILEPDTVRLRHSVKTEQEDPSCRFFADLAAELGIYLLVGSLALKAEEDKLVNRSLLFSPSSHVLARYDKIHLFDVQLGHGQVYSESRTYKPGSRAVCANLPWGRLGLTICYDLRFPGLYQLLARSGALFLSVPSAFTQPTGEAHWHVLLRARAIENGAFVLAPAQGGHHESGRNTFGHSIVVDPWGNILAELANDDPGYLVADIDPKLAEQARKRIPSLSHDRIFDQTNLV